MRAKRHPAEDWTEGGAIRSPGEAQYQRELLDFRIDAYLRKAGWCHTSDTPGCYVLWERKVGNRVVLVDRLTALRIQEHLPATSAVKEPGT